MTKQRQMSIWGIGPKLTVGSLVCFVLALAAHYAWYPLFVIRGIPYAVLSACGLIMVSAGIPLWVAASREVDRAFEAGELATQGVCGLCRHPIYGAATFLVVPGILLFFRSWILLAVPVAMYVLGRFLVQHEEAHLREEFGQPYLEYAERVNALLPRFWRLYSTMWYPVDTGQVAERVYAVRVRDVNAFIYTDEEDTVAIDATYAAAPLLEELRSLRIAPQSVTHVFLTHADLDHAGGLDAFPNAEVYLSTDEEQMIDGTTARFLGLYHCPVLSRQYHLLEAGEIVTVGAIEVQAISTPGHTPGSMSYLLNGRALFTGDTLILRNRQARAFYRLFNNDTALQKQSIRKLGSAQGIDLLCTAHTGCTRDYSRAMRSWRGEAHGASLVRATRDAETGGKDWRQQ
jgi:hydroxyacylglutathione hydrolase